MKVNVITFSQAPSDTYLTGINRRKIKKFKRKGYIIDIVPDLKLFSHSCGRYTIGYDRDYGVLQEFWLVPRTSMKMDKLFSHITDMNNSRQLYFNRSFRCNDPSARSFSLRDFLEIDPDCDEYTIDNCTNPNLTMVDLFRVFKNEREYATWKLYQ